MEIYSFNNSTASNISQDEDGKAHPSMEEIYFYYYLYNVSIPLIFAVVTFVGVFGNALVIYVIMSSPAMRTTTNILLLNLAVADISFLVICVPSTAVKYAADSWPLGDVMCKMINYFLFVTAYVTMYTLVVVSVLRYLTIVHSHRTARFRNKNNMLMIAVFLWGFGLSVNIPVYMIHSENRIEMYDFVYCGMTNQHHGKPLYTVFFIFGYIVPLFAICVLYFSILRHLQEAKRSSIVDRSSSSDRTSKATRIILSVVIIFGVCWLPMHIDLMVNYFGTTPKTKFYTVLQVIFKCMAYANSCVNPFIYNYVSRDFRDKFRDVLCRNRLCKKEGTAFNGYQTTATEMTEMKEV